MRWAAVAALACAGLGACIAFATDSAPAADPPPARLQVGAYEFRYALSRLRIKSGRAIVQLVNYGEDDHNLRLRRVGSDYTHRLPRTEPGEMSELRTRLRAGKFDLWCSLPGHAEAGMRATLRVVKPPRNPS
jgi:plastocyanin